MIPRCEFMDGGGVYVQKKKKIKKSQKKRDGRI